MIINIVMSCSAYTFLEFSSSNSKQDKTKMQVDQLQCSNCNDCSRFKFVFSLSTRFSSFSSHPAKSNERKKYASWPFRGAGCPIVAATNWCLASQLTVSSDVRTKRALIANAANPFVNVLLTLSQSYAAQRNVL